MNTMTIPTRYHMGVIPDGNRRWALANNVHPSEGHVRGAQKMELLVNWALRHNDVKELSVYGLSEENFKRNPKELAWLYDIGYRSMMLCDELCLKDELLELAVSAFDAFRTDYS